MDADDAEQLEMFSRKLRTHGDPLSTAEPFIDVRYLTHSATYIDVETQEPIVVVCRQVSYQSPHGDYGDSIDHYALSLKFLEKVADNTNVPQQHRLIQLTGDVKRAVERGYFKQVNVDEIKMPQDMHNFNGVRNVGIAP
jgi:hypothetical protein